MRTTRIVSGIAAALFATVALTPLQAWADAGSEAMTAETHADLAVHAADLKGVHTHLHHTVNCLAGPHGEGFDAKEINPCIHSGNGAIPDATDQAMKDKLEAAKAKAMEGIAATDIETAKRDATETSTMLKNLK